MYIFPKRSKLDQNITMSEKLLPFNANSLPAVEVSMPYFAIQCDWDEILKRNKGKVWASVRRKNDDISSHVTLMTDDNSVTSSEPFLKPKVSTSRYITVQDTISEAECSFLAPVAAYNNIHKSRISTLDVTEGGLGVSASNNEIKIWETETGTVRRTLEGHIADVHTCKFFPSGVVLLTAGCDLQLKIWSVETGENPVSLKGHAGSILDTCIVDRGRNVVSVSKDGTARLWDCGMSTTLATLVNCEASINACCISSPSAIELKSRLSSQSDREVGTAGKLLLLAREDSKVQGVGIGSRENIFTVPVPSAANSVVFTGPNSFTVGCQNGEIATFDLRKIVPPKKIHSVTPTPILSLMSHPRSPSSRPSSDESQRFFWAAKNDGTCVLVNPSSQSHGHLKNLVQLTGPDHDPIYSVKHDGSYIFTACRDGIIRKYSINHVTQLCN